MKGERFPGVVSDCTVTRGKDGRWAVQLTGTKLKAFVRVLPDVGFVGESESGAMIAGPAATRFEIVNALARRLRRRRPAAEPGQLVAGRLRSKVAHIVDGADPGGARTLCSTRLSAPLRLVEPGEAIICAGCQAAARAAQRRRPNDQGGSP